jgi:hypothetical protein
LTEALQSISSVETTDETLESCTRTEVASTSGDVDMQQPSGEEVKLDFVLELGKKCLESTVEGTWQDLPATRMLLIDCMSLICEHRNQLDSRLDLQMAIGDFAPRFLYFLFSLGDYEECIRWFETGMRTEDVLKGVLEASGSVQYNVAISFLKSAHVKTDPRRQNKIGRGCYHLQRSFELQVEDFDSLKARIQMIVKLEATDSITVTLGRLLLVPGEMFEKLLGTPYSHFTDQQALDLSDEVLALARGMQDQGWLVEVEAVLKMGRKFASIIQDEEMRNRLRDFYLTQIRKLYRSRGQYKEAAETHELSESKISNFRERQVIASETAEDWSLAGDHNRAIDIITTAYSAVDVGDAPDGVPLPYEDWKLKAHLKFTYGRILERAGLANDAVQQMEEARALCSRFNYNGDDEGVNVGLGGLLQLYREDEKYIESVLPLIAMVESIASKPECIEDFRMHWKLQEGLFWYEVRDRDNAEECLRAAARAAARDNGTDESDGGTDESDGGTDEPDGGTDEPDGGADKPDGQLSDFQREVNKLAEELYKKHMYFRCSRCKGNHLRDSNSHWRTFFNYAKLNWKFFVRALAASVAAELVVRRRLGGEPGERTGLVEVYMLRGSILISNHEHYEAYQAYEQAAFILQNMNQDDYKVRKRLSFCYAMQARQKLERGGELDGSLDLIKRAAPELEMENPGLYFYLQAMANRLQVPCKSQEATALGEMAARELIKTLQSRPFQTQFSQMAWIRAFEESTLMSVFKFNERLSLTRLRIRNALIWAERGRTRLYMRISDKNQTSGDYSSEQFDFCFKHAEELLGDALLMCGADTAIISYSYVRYGNIFEDFISYLTFKEGEHIMIHI